MKYVLMHKDVPVVAVDIDEVLCGIKKIEEVYNKAHLPVGIHIRHDQVDRAELNAWWIDRSIPASRSGVRNALETLNLTNTRTLLTKCFGLSLSDQYWIRPCDNENLHWKDINFFEHPFSEDIGDVLLGKASKKGAFDFRSPDNTSDGCLKKRWKILNGKRCLIKAGSAPLMLQPFNEVIATKIMEKLNIPNVPYRVIWDDDNIPYSVCEDFINGNTELVSAWRIMQIRPKANHESVYMHIVNICKELGILDITEALNKMIVLDYIIANEDRHLNNFGLVRNADTLEWIGFAPIYDSGSSLGYSMLPAQIISDKATECKPFKKTHDDQIKLVSDFSWIDFSKLQDIDTDIRNVFTGAEIYADENRINAIITSVKRRIDYLQLLAKEKTVAVDNVADDVEKNKAEDYLRTETDTEDMEL